MEDRAIKYPDSDEIEPEQAIFLYQEHCAVLIVEDLPVGSEFGIDMTAHQVGEKFKGVKLIPPGVHFVYASAVDRNTYQCGPRLGFFHNFKTKEILIKKWSPSDEDFDDSYRPSEEQYKRFQTNLKELDRYLGAYRFSNYKAYLDLSSKITPTVIAQLMPSCNRIRSVPYLVSDGKAEHTGPLDRTPTEHNIVPHLKPKQTTVINFTKCEHKPIDPKLVTQCNIDTTVVIEKVFGLAESGQHQLLAEFQFAFITFLLCHVYECFEHWKKLLKLICIADDALTRMPLFFSEFIQILSHQIDYIHEELFEDIVDSNNLVRCLLDTFFQNVNDQLHLTDELKQQAQRLRTKLEDKFDWKFDLEREDEQPVVVEEM